MLVPAAPPRPAAAAAGGREGKREGRRGGAGRRARGSVLPRLGWGAVAVTAPCEDVPASRPRLSATLRAARRGGRLGITSAVFSIPSPVSQGCCHAKEGGALF